MVNFQNPATLARELAAAINLWHTVDGILIWEFFTTLNYEWDVIRGHRPYKWTIWVYSLTRVSALMATVLNMFGYDHTTKIICQAQFTMSAFFFYVAFGSASLLIVIRIIAIWNRKTIIVLITMGVWLTDVAFLIYGTVRVRGVWSDESSSCVLTNLQTNKINLIISLGSDIVLLLIMLVGLLRLRLEIGNFGLGRILWNQNLVWLFLATVAEVPPALFFCLNLNDAWDVMFQCPNLVIMTIASTRMYRSLINLGTADVSSEVTHPVSKLRFRSQPVSESASLAQAGKQMSVQASSRTDTSEQYPMSLSKVVAETTVQTLTEQVGVQMQHRSLEK